MLRPEVRFTGLLLIICNLSSLLPLLALGWVPDGKTQSDDASIDSGDDVSELEDGEGRAREATLAASASRSVDEDMARDKRE
eukprot:1484197-Pleurochrysis_carterae.AAC.2